jgi:hypothetical protein
MHAICNGVESLVCQPALPPSPASHPPNQDYLETKRIAFPRFYFVAPAGGPPQQTCLACSEFVS